MNAVKVNIQNSTDAAEILEYVFESLARSLLPVIQKYYESEDGKRHLSKGKQRRRFRTVRLHKGTGRIAMIGSPPAFLLQVFNFFHKNNKSEPITNRQKVRIILFWSYASVRRFVRSSSRLAVCIRAEIAVGTAIVSLVRGAS